MPASIQWEPISMTREKPSGVEKIIVQSPSAETKSSARRPACVRPIAFCFCCKSVESLLTISSREAQGRGICRGRGKSSYRGEAHAEHKNAHHLKGPLYRRISVPAPGGRPRSRTTNLKALHPERSSYKPVFQPRFSPLAVARGSLTNTWDSDD